MHVPGKPRLSRIVIATTLLFRHSEGLTDEVLGNANDSTMSEGFPLDDDNTE